MAVERVLTMEAFAAGEAARRGARRRGRPSPRARVYVDLDELDAHGWRFDELELELVGYRRVA